MKKLILLLIISSSVMSMRIHSVMNNSVSLAFCNNTQEVTWKFCKEVVRKQKEVIVNYMNDNNINGHLSVSGVVDLDQDLGTEAGKICTLILTLDNSNKKISKKIAKTKNSWTDKKRFERLSLKLDQLSEQEGHVVSSSRFLSGGTRSCSYSPLVGGHEVESVYLKD